MHGRVERYRFRDIGLEIACAGRAIWLPSLLLLLFLFFSFWFHGIVKGSLYLFFFLFRGGLGLSNVELECLPSLPLKWGEGVFAEKLSCTEISLCNEQKQS